MWTTCAIENGANFQCLCEGSDNPAPCVLFDLRNSFDIGYIYNGYTILQPSLDVHVAVVLAAFFNISNSIKAVTV